MNRVARMGHRLVTFVLIAVSLAACKKSTPAGPSPSTPTRIIALSGDLGFGNVEVGSRVDRTLRIANSGNAALTVTSLSGPFADVFFASWTSGAIAAGGVQEVTLGFRPSAAQSYNGTLTVNSDATSGGNTIGFVAAGVRTGPLWTMSGSGNTVFDMPTYVARVKIRGTWNQTGTSNFVVRIAGRVIVNEILRDSITYEGIHLTNGGGVTEITISSSIAWAFEEVR